MKSKTNISVVSNTGVRRKSEVIIGDSGTYTSGDILDANATQELIGSGGGGAISDEQFVHFTVHQDETITTDITQSELDSLIEKYKYMVYGIVTIEDITMILPLVQVISSTTEPIYIFSSPGYSSGYDVIVKYKNGESNVELHSLAQIINELIQG